MNVLLKTKREDYLFLTAEINGEKEYYLNGFISEKEEGNKTYLEVKKEHKDVEIIKITEENKKDIIEYYLRRYDRYVEYIDDYRQWSRQRDLNDRVYSIAKLIDKCVESKNEKEIKEVFHKYVY